MKKKNRGKKIVFYSKSASHYMSANSSFFAQNQKLLEKSHADNHVYKAQPLRPCKLCLSALDEETDFVSHGVGYTFCDKCGHLNGVHDDTEAFSRHLYEEEDGGRYSHYTDEDFSTRIEYVYQPKIKFLREALKNESCMGLPDKIQVLDVGCGAGHFVYACLREGIDARGIDVNRKSIDFGNRKISSKFSGISPLTLAQPDDIYSEVVASKADILTAIGVIEHLRAPRRLLEAFRLSKIKYMLFLVPMYSASAIFENLFPNTYPRLLSGGHTHLFTNQSLEWFYEAGALVPVAEWRFGADAMDLYRSILVSLKANGSSERHLRMTEEMFRREIDKIQAVFDKAHICSELHCVVAKR
jgi:ubiquinone/menaquinone biosynthesis C-methylase UbiE